MMIEQDTTLLGEALPVVLAWMKAHCYEFLQTDLRIYADPPLLSEIPVTSAKVEAIGTAISANEVFWGKTLVQLATNLTGFDQETHDILAQRIWSFWKALKQKFPESIAESPPQLGRSPRKKGASGRPSHEDDIWAISAIDAGRDWRQVYAAWVVRPGVVKRELSDPTETFRKNIRNKVGRKE